MWMAPGIRPSFHSSSSRTSTTSGGSSAARSSRARVTSTSSISDLTCCKQFAIGRHRFRKRSDAASGLRSGRGNGSPAAGAARNRRVVLVVVLAAVVAAAAVVGITLLQTRGRADERSRRGPPGPLGASAAPARVRPARATPRRRALAQAQTLFDQRPAGCRRGGDLPPLPLGRGAARPRVRELARAGEPRGA